MLDECGQLARGSRERAEVDKLVKWARIERLAIKVYDKLHEFASGGTWGELAVSTPAPWSPPPGPGSAGHPRPRPASLSRQPSTLSTGDGMVDGSHSISGDPPTSSRKERGPLPAMNRRRGGNTGKRRRSLMGRTPSPDGDDVDLAQSRPGSGGHVGGSLTIDVSSEPATSFTSSHRDLQVMVELWLQ